MIRYTGDETDIATCYQFVMNDLEGYAALVRDFPFEPVPTPKGTCFKSFCGLGENCLDDFVCDFVDDGYRIDNPATDMIAAIQATKLLLWRLRTSDAHKCVRQMLVDMQQRLIRGGVLPSDATETGIMDQKTPGAAQKFVYGDSKQFALIPTGYDYLRKLAMESSELWRNKMIERMMEWVQLNLIKSYTGKLGNRMVLDTQNREVSGLFRRFIGVTAPTRSVESRYYQSAPFGYLWISRLFHTFFRNFFPDSPQNVRDHPFVDICPISLSQRRR